MPAVRSIRIQTIKEHLLERLTGDYQFHGGRFPSARELTSRYKISYQTADRLLRELVDEGFLIRRHGAGTFVASESSLPPKKALLIFNRRARRADSFGHELLHRLEAHLHSRSLPFEMTWDRGTRRIEPGYLAVLWETSRDIVVQTVANRSFALLLNSAPEPGLQTTWVDSVAVDDFSGGVCAAQMLAPSIRNGKIIVLGGPKGDPRSRERIAGFCSLVKKASVIHAGTWYAEEAASSALQVVRAKPTAVFCCNDRLAQALLSASSKAKIPPPRLVGFDDAPIARELNFSTVALPWEGLVQAAGDRILKRLSGDAGHAARILLAPRPIYRSRNSRAPMYT